MHPDQIPLSSALAAELVHRQFSAAAGGVHMLDTAATTSHVFRVGEQYLARFPLRRGDAAASARELRSERSAMREFAEASPFPSPLMIFIGEPSPEYPMPWSVQTWVPGRPVTPRSHETSSPLARDLAMLVRTLRRADVEGRSFEGSGRGGELVAHDEWVAHCLAQSASMLPTERLRHVWADLRGTRRNEPDVMSHKDLTPFNLLAEHGLTGVLDTGGFGPADPALDLVAAWHVFDAARREEFRELVASSEDEWRRGIAWALQQALGLVWYYGTSNPAMSDLGRTTIERILDSGEVS